MWCQTILIYIQKKKHTPYNECQQVPGGNMNSVTTRKRIKPGVNDSFREFLSLHELNRANAGVLKAQLTQMIGEHYKDNEEQLNFLKKEEKTVRENIEKIAEKYLVSDSLDEQTYLKVKRKFEYELSEIVKKIKTAS